MKLNGLENYFKTDENGFIVDFKQVNENTFTPIMYVFLNNKYKNLNLNKEQFNYLIKNSDLKQFDFDGWNYLILALIYNKSENLNLTLEQFEYMINNSDLSLIYNCESELVIQELKNIQSEINNNNILSKINNKQIKKGNKI